MVNTSLKEYLKTKNLSENIIINLFDTKYWTPTEDFRKDFSQQILTHLNQLKIIDPACGSGAFPMGVLQKLTEIIHALEPKNKKGELLNLYEIKKEILQNSIFGVDILPIAVEISRLRCWLSLVVDEEKNKPELLPNLEFKFVCANSLVGIDFSVFNLQTQDNIFGGDIGIIKDSLQEIQSIRKETFKPGVDKNKLEKDFVEIKNKLTAEATKIGVEDNQNNQKVLNEGVKISDWNPFNNEPSKFFDSNWMFGESGFDLVIGNPPYVGEKGNKGTFEPLKKSELGNRFYQGKMDLFYFFFHLGLDILKPSGILGYITTNYYITATGGTKLRNDFKARSSILKMINFGEFKIFKSAEGQHNLITILQKECNPEKEAELCITNNKGDIEKNPEIIQNIIEGKDQETEYYKQNNNTIYYEKENYIGFWSAEYTLIFNKMVSASKRLGEICEVNSGIQSGADTLTDKHISKFGGIGSKGDGIFVLDLQNPSDKTLFESIPLNEKDILKPFYKNSDIVKYSVDKKATKYIIYITKKTQIANYPIILKHLEKFKTILQEKRETKTGQIPWYSLHWARNQSIFESEKVIVSYRSNSNIFGYSVVLNYFSIDIFVITQPRENYNLKFLLGVLNSKLIYEWLYYRGKRKGEMLELYQEPLSKIPIPILDTPEKCEIAGQIEILVEKILSMKMENAENNVLENQIDKLVFELYDLSEEEIAVVENQT